MKSTHTPGPWKWDESFGAIVSTGHTKRLVCPMWTGCNKSTMDQYELDTDEANARLIAAAPELLAACEELGRLWDAGIRPQIVQGALREETDFATLCMVTLRAAISKAKGGEA